MERIFTPILAFPVNGEGTLYFDDAVDVDCGRMYAVAVYLADIYYLIHLHGCGARGCCHHSVEVAGSSAIDDIAQWVGLVRSQQGEIGFQPMLQHMWLAVKDARVSLPSASSVPAPVGV